MQIRSMWNTYSDDRCPYYAQGVLEDEDHLLWWCTAWKATREPFLAEVMMLAKAIKLGALSVWPPCVRLCGLMPESVVKRSGMARGAGWKKRCRELNQVTCYWEPNPQEARDNTEVALMGHPWAEDDGNPLEQFVHKLQGMF